MSSPKPKPASKPSLDDEIAAYVAKLVATAPPIPVERRIRLRNILSTLDTQEDVEKTA